MATDTSPLLAALMQHKVSATVVDFDHHRIHGGVAVETDYIVSVEPSGEIGGGVSFAAFKISKTYHSFRTLASQLRKISECAAKSSKDWDSLPSEVKHAIKFSESVVHLVDSQPTQYLGKVNFKYVKSLSQQRSQTINDVLDSVLQNFPTDTNLKVQKFVREIAEAIEVFFLTDHCVEEDASTECLPPDSPAPGSSGLNRFFQFTPGKGAQIGDIGNLLNAKKGDSALNASRQDQKTLLSPVVPVTQKRRASVIVRAQDEADLKREIDAENILLDDDRGQATLLPSYSAPVSVGQSNGSKLGDIVENNPYVFMVIIAVSLWILRSASYTSVTVDTDIALLIVFAFFCLGFHMPRPARVGVDGARAVLAPVVTFQKEKVGRRSSALLLRKSMLSTPTSKEAADQMWAELDELEEEEQAPQVLKSPMDMFPPDAELGSRLNCWSEPSFADFKVRGANYLQDKKKTASGSFLFPMRGVDLFLTDACPENVGRNSGVLGGALRDLPTFVINYRLPWGVLLLYFEIPDFFLPFIKKSYDPDFDDSTLPSLDEMTPGVRAACRFLMGNDQYKNERLKIVPIVVKGPWVVQSVVGGKPAILGNKLPVNYVYQRREGDKAEYLEADLDIVASSAARGILSVCRSYTQGLTMDLGFVVQGNGEDELPEQMLTGTRLHGIDPLNAPPLPPMKDLYMEVEATDSIVEDTGTAVPAAVSP